jgi:Lar family restriction alleviation protein
MDKDQRGQKRLDGKSHWGDNMLNIDSSGLMPCPFCGGKADSYWIDGDNLAKEVVINCVDCTARVETSEVIRPDAYADFMRDFRHRCKVAAEAAWNRRA